MNSIKTPVPLDDRLQRLLGGPELASLRLRFRRYFERLDNGAARDQLRLTQLSAAEHEALSLLTGHPSRLSSSLQIDIGHLDAALSEAGIAGSLRMALELIDGPILNRAAHRIDMQAQWHRLARGGHWHDALTEWLQTSVAIGRLKSLTGQNPVLAQQLVDRANIVLRRLPANGVPRSQLAAETLGSAHALDSGEPVAAIVLAAWRCLEFRNTSVVKTLDEDNRQDGIPLPEEHVRDIWARAGVLVNELARPALVLNVPVASHNTAIVIPGQPGYLSLRLLLRTPPEWAVNGVTVSVCENPNLVAIAADQLGAASAPLVCTDGMPAAAQRTLLTQLEHAGAQLRYHGDFDWPGLKIANYVMRTWKARPWRLSSKDYESFAMSAPHTRHALSGPCAAASWDMALTSAMQHYGIAIAEEAVAGSLLEDLRQIV